MRQLLALVFLIFVSSLLMGATSTKVTLHKDPLPKNFAETEDSNVSVTDTLYAYDFESKSMDAKSVKLADYRGKWVFLDFFATW